MYIQMLVNIEQMSLLRHSLGLGQVDIWCWGDVVLLGDGMAMTGL